jgi:drug/metabolite transporter (DMT)-like permease
MASTTRTRRERAAHVGERHPIALLVLGVFVFSTGPVMVQWSDLTGPVLSFWRLWIGTGGLALLTLIHIRVTRRSPTREGWAWAGRAGIVFGLHQLMFMTAIKATSVVDVTLMQVLAPIVVAVMAVPMFGERPGPSFRLWSVVAVVGAAVVVAAGSTGPEGEPLGMLLAAGNVVMYAFFFLWSKQGRRYIDVVPFLLGATGTAALTVTAFVVLTGEKAGSAGRGDLALALLIAAVPGGIGHFVSTWPLRWVPANIPPLLHLAIPFLSGALAWLLLGERISLLHFLGGVLTIAGVAGAVRSSGGRRLVRDQANSGITSVAN